MTNKPSPLQAAGYCRLPHPTERSKLRGIGPGEIKELLANTSVCQHRSLLEKLLIFVCRDGNLASKQHINGFEFLDIFSAEMDSLQLEARSNLENIKKIAGIDEGELDLAIHDSFSKTASDLNNEGVNSQIRYLVVEHGFDPKAVRDACE